MSKQSLRNKAFDQFIETRDEQYCFLNHKQKDLPCTIDSFNKFDSITVYKQMQYSSLNIMKAIKKQD